MAKNLPSKQITTDVKRHVTAFHFTVPEDGGPIEALVTFTTTIKDSATGDVVSRQVSELKLNDATIKGHPQFAALYSTLHDFFHGERDKKGD